MRASSGVTSGGRLVMILKRLLARASFKVRWCSLYFFFSAGF